MAVVMDITPYGDEFPTLPDFWNVTRDVYPGGNNISTDVMLIQTLLMIFAISSAPSEAQRRDALAIISSGKRNFNDGIYGPKTRSMVRIYEDNTSAPFKDGIIRRNEVIQAAMPYGFTKLKGLNVIWDVHLGDGAAGATKQAQGAVFLPIILYRELYGGYPI
jgi:hypothetical protein